MKFQRIVGCIIVPASMVLFTAVPCYAQKPVEQKVGDHTCTVNVAGGAVWPFGKEGDNFNRGWTLQAGGGFAVSRPREPGRGVQWFITANYMYARLDATAAALAKITGTPGPLSGAISAHGSFSAVTIDPTVRNLIAGHVLGDRASVYASGGFGWFHRGVGINGANTATLLQPAAATLGTATSNSGVFDLGAGVNIAPKPLGGLMVYVEGGVYKGAAINSSTTLVPLSAGVRW